MRKSLEKPYRLMSYKWRLLLQRNEVVFKVTVGIRKKLIKNKDSLIKKDEVKEKACKLEEYTELKDTYYTLLERRNKYIF